MSFWTWATFTVYFISVQVTLIQILFELRKLNKNFPGGYVDPTKP